MSAPYLQAGILGDATRIPCPAAQPDRKLAGWPIHLFEQSASHDPRQRANPRQPTFPLPRIIPPFIVKTPLNREHLTGRLDTNRWAPGAFQEGVHRWQLPSTLRFVGWKASEDVHGTLMTPVDTQSMNGLADYRLVGGRA